MIIIPKNWILYLADLFVMKNSNMLTGWKEIMKLLCDLLRNSFIHIPHRHVLQRFLEECLSACVGLCVYVRFKYVCVCSCVHDNVRVCV